MEKTIIIDPEKRKQLAQRYRICLSDCDHLPCQYWAEVLELRASLPPDPKKTFKRVSA